MAIFSDAEIMRSWHMNAVPWIKAIEQGEIESRQLVTNKIIVDHIVNFYPTRVLDLGCGEGWLTRELACKGISVLGMDAVSFFIEKARKITQAQFAVCTYEQLPEYLFNESFDCIVCNFSLLGKESTEIVIQTSSKILKKQGRLMIQTLHPVAACGDFFYEDGWRPGSWNGFNKDFKDPAPWYFRTIESWCKLLYKNKFQIINIHEPVHPKTKKPASIIFECGIKDSSNLSSKKKSSQ